MLRPDPFMSVIIPTYNEEERIGGTLEKIAAYLSRQNYSHQIIVVDDASSDKTVKIIEDFREKIVLLRNKRRKGKGYSVRQGVLSATGDFVLFSDADLSTPIEELEKLLFWLEKGYHLALGSRRLPDSEISIPQPFLRRLMGKIFNLLVRIFVVRGFCDTQCGFKCFEKKTANFLFGKQRLSGFCFDVEILYLAEKFKKRAKEVPVRWLNSPVSKIGPLKHSFLMFLDLFRVKLNDLRGVYDYPGD